MDPDANLKEQLELAAEIMAIDNNCAEDGTLTEEQAGRLSNAGERLAQLVEALDGWLTKGGFRPARWKR